MKEFWENIKGPVGALIVMIVTLNAILGTFYFWDTTCS